MPRSPSDLSIHGGLVEDAQVNGAVDHRVQLAVGPVSPKIDQRPRHARAWNASDIDDLNRLRLPFVVHLYSGLRSCVARGDHVDRVRGKARQIEPLGSTLVADPKPTGNAQQTRAEPR
jgi:hypothetical protein